MDDGQSICADVPALAFGVKLSMQKLLLDEQVLNHCHCIEVVASSSNGKQKANIFTLELVRWLNTSCLDNSSPTSSGVYQLGSIRTLLYDGRSERKAKSNSNPEDKKTATTGDDCCSCQLRLFVNKLIEVRNVFFGWYYNS